MEEWMQEGKEDGRAGELHIERGTGEEGVREGGIEGRGRGGRDDGGR